MELKRYVLDTQRCFIYDLTKEADVKKFEMISKFATHFVNGACKTSDDILDLIEHGDLVKIGRYIPPVYVADITNVNGTRKPIGDWWLGGKFYRNIMKTDNSFITAIYKLQPNGDDKRYEVER